MDPNTTLPSGNLSNTSPGLQLCVLRGACACHAPRQCCPHSPRADTVFGCNCSPRKPRGSRNVAKLYPLPRPGPRAASWRCCEQLQGSMLSLCALASALPIASGLSTRSTALSRPASTWPSEGAVGRVLQNRVHPLSSKRNLQVKYVCPPVLACALLSRILCLYWPLTSRYHS